MLQILALSKVYKSMGNHECVALDEVSFDLPDKGMVFIVGKSGSGKSTLLNMLSGLDKITGGEIIADGNLFSQFSEQDYDNYRNSYVGFVFQDFCLIEGLTVEQNVNLSLELQSIEDAGRLKKTLAEVGLDGYADRFPRELSGGQKQRVAIARALVKNPKIILADEPTGNLDSVTSVQVLKLFKKLSKTKLVVVVSHSLDDAKKYADRIIELADGKIIKDQERNSQFFSKFAIVENTIHLPNTKLTKSQLDKINNKIKEGNASICQSGEEFVDAVSTIPKPRKKVKITGGDMSLKNISKLSFKFLKSRKLGSIFTVIMVALVVTLLGISQMFCIINPSNIISQALIARNDDAFVLKKGYFSDDAFQEIHDNRISIITNDDMSAFSKTGYEGNVYKLYNSPIATGEDSFRNENFQTTNNRDNYRNLYSREAKGVLQCDDQFLTKIYGVDGQLNVLAGSTENLTYEIIVTDYFADSILYYNWFWSLPVPLPFPFPQIEKTAESAIFDRTTFKRSAGDLSDVLGVGEVDNEVGSQDEEDYADKYQTLLNKTLFTRYTIGAVIATNYKTKYAEVFSDFENIDYSEGTRAASTQIKELQRTELYLDFVEELNTTLNVAYSFNPNYLQDSIDNSAGNRHHAKAIGSVSSVTGDFIYQNHNVNVFTSLVMPELTLASGETAISLWYFNSLFGVEYSIEDADKIVGNTLTFTHYNSNYEATDAAAYTKTFTIVQVYKSTPYPIIVSHEDYLFMRSHDSFAYALYFDNFNNIASLYDVGKSLAFVPISHLFKAVHSIAEIVTIFVDYFSIVSLGLCLICVLLLMNFGMGNVKNRIYEIGVLRALGGKNSNIGKLFVVQMLFVSLIICVLTSVSMFFATAFSNQLLANNFLTYLNNPILQNIKIINFSPIIMFIDLLLVLIITIISSFAPVRKLRKIKPTNILKAKD